jgi:hypothetical protein
MEKGGQQRVAAGARYGENVDVAAMARAGVAGFPTYDYDRLFNLNRKGKSTRAGAPRK